MNSNSKIKFNLLILVISIHIVNAFISVKKNSLYGRFVLEDFCSGIHKGTDWTLVLELLFKNINSFTPFCLFTTKITLKDQERLSISISFLCWSMFASFYGYFFAT